jgi:uncharacterized protein with HEPN domain
MQPDLVRVRHMLDAAREVQQFTAGRSREDLDRDQLLVRGVTKSIEIIGEAAARVSAAFSSAHPEIPWQDATSMRNRLVHGYFDIDLDIVWSTARQDVPALAGLLETLIAAISTAE